MIHALMPSVCRRAGAFVLTLGTLAAPACPAAPPDAAASASALTALESWISTPRPDRPDLTAQPFAGVALTREDARKAKSRLWDDHAASIRASRAGEMRSKVIEIGGRSLRFESTTFGDAPPTGHSLFISMHGGGNTDPEVNDSQWRNQLKLGQAYKPSEGIYVAPRAPTNTWNLWHEAHIDGLFDRLIENFIVFEGVNPNRVYLLGYSAGGDGVYQLAPRMADRFAAASMMAGHPNETSPLGLRNIGFALHVGELDSPYDRNKVAREWGQKLDDLQKADPIGYAHQVMLHPGKEHWMGLEDRVAIPWMERFTRNPWPDVVVWKQDDLIHPRLYWLAVDPAKARAGDEITARFKDGRISLKINRPIEVSLLLDDALVDLDQPLVVVSEDGARPLFSGTPTRTLRSLHSSLATRPQPPLLAAARIELPAPPAEEKK